MKKSSVTVADGYFVTQTYYTFFVIIYDGRTNPSRLATLS